MRVIAGEAKGRELLAPRGMHTRPTLAKVKEAMFGMIQFDIEDAKVLDLFAGSGSLGIEAISRGAAHVTFCDNDRDAFSTVRTNLKRLFFEDRATLIQSEALAALERIAWNGDGFDIVLLDPPYATDLESKAIQRLAELELLNPGAILLCEHSQDNPPVFPEGFEIKKAKKYGDTFVTYATFKGEVTE